MTLIWSDTLKKRVLSGLFLAPLVAAVIIYGSWPFFLMLGFALCAALYEWFYLATAKGRHYVLFAGGVLYVVLCFVSFAHIRTGFDSGAFLALCAILCVWASDTGAYFTGKILQGPKLLPAVSPNKTWAGLAGAMFFCGLTLYILFLAGFRFLSGFPYIAGDEGLTGLSIFVGGLFLGAIGQAGDLLVSFFKRKAGQKDTGHLIPGHGGLLDRVDSLLLVSPAFLILLLLWAM